MLAQDTGMIFCFLYYNHESLPCPENFFFSSCACSEEGRAKVCQVKCFSLDIPYQVLGTGEMDSTSFGNSSSLSVEEVAHDEDTNLESSILYIEQVIY